MALGGGEVVDRARGHMNPFRFRSDIVQYIEDKTLSAMSHSCIRGIVSHTTPSSTSKNVHVRVVEARWFQRMCRSKVEDVVIG